MASLRHGHRLDSMSGLLRIVRAFGTRSELIETLEVHLSTDPDDMAALIEQLSYCRRATQDLLGIDAG